MFDFVPFIEKLVRTTDSSGTVVKFTNKRYREIISFANQVNIFYSDCVTRLKDGILFEKTLKFSSNNTGNEHFEELKLLATAELKNINFKQRTLDTISKIQNTSDRTKLNNKIQEIMSEYYKQLRIEFENRQDEYVEREKCQITESLKGDCIFNLSKSPVPQEITEWVQNGPKFNPYVLKHKDTYLRDFDIQFSTIINRIIKYHHSPIIIPPTNLKENLEKFSNITKNLKLKEFLTGVSKSYVIQRRRYRNEVKKPSKTNSDHIITEKKLQDLFSFQDKRIIVCADKNMGFSVLENEDYLDQYRQINEKQNFGRTAVIEEDYLNFIENTISEARESIPTELSSIIKKKHFDNNITNKCIGVLRLMPKVAKLKEINYASIKELKSRGIRSSLNDPLKIIQSVLNKIFGHILYFMEKHFHERFNRLSPSVTGINEAIQRITEVEHGEWGQSLEVQSDFSDLYSNIDEKLLKHNIAIGCKLANISESSQAYIFHLVEINMRNSYFKEPEGIFRTLTGFSMGDLCAADGSLLVLRGDEISIYVNLHNANLFLYINRYLRFRDDITFNLSGPVAKIQEALKIISTGYSASLQLNTEINSVAGKFLNLRIYNLDGHKKAITTILRKKNCKYVITPPHSNTDPIFKKCAGQTYYNMVKTHCTDKKEKIRQNSVVDLILRKKGFNTRQINSIKKRKHQTATSREEKQKLYIGKVTFDNVVSTHKYMRKIFKIPEFDSTRFSMPMQVPGKKLLQYIFTISKMRKKLGF